MGAGGAGGGRGGGRAELRGFEGELWAEGERGYAPALRAAAAANAAAGRRRPELLARPAGPDDVRRCVRAARARARGGEVPASTAPLSVRGGGHSDLCLLDGALAVDLSWGMNWVECDPRSCTVRCGGGATLAALQSAAGEHGMACPVGLHDTVGVGLLLQGGVGRLSRRWGLAVDKLLGVQMVTASGDIVALGQGFESSPGVGGSGQVHRDGERERDLWWCARGAAPNFGIVTAVALRAFLVGPVLHGRVPCSIPRGISLESTAGAFAQFEEAARFLPRGQQVDCVLGLTSGGNPAGAFFPCSLDGQPFERSVVRAMGLADGEGRGPDCPTGYFKRSSFRSVPYPTLEGLSAPEHPSELGGARGSGAGGSTSMQTKVVAYVRQCFVDRLGPAGWLVLLRAVEAAPSGMAEIMLQHAGGEVRARKADCVAFAPRSWEFSVVVVACWKDSSEQARRENEAWADAAYNSLQPFTTGLYAADIDPLRRPGSVAAEVQGAFQGNLPRLAGLKQRHDPDGLFRGTCPLLPLRSTAQPRL